MAVSSSVDSLTALFRQLRSIEDALTNLLFEVVLRLQNLTEAKVFLCVESSDQRRRFGGSAALISAFVDGRLGAGDADAEVQLLDTDVLKELALTRTTRKRSSTTPEHVAPKRSRTHFGANGDLTQRPNSKSSIFSATYPSNDIRDGFVIGDHPPFSSPFENPRDVDRSLTADVDAGRSFDVKDVVKIDHDLDDDDKIDDDIIELLIESDVEERSNHKTSSSPYTHTNQRSTASTSTFISSPTSSFAGKMEALQGVVDPWLVFQRGTVENKLLSSLLYDFGKDLAQNCRASMVTLKDSNVNSYFVNAVSNFVEANLFRFIVDRRLNPRDGAEDDALRGSTCDAFFRSLARTGFKAGVLRMNKERGKKDNSQFCFF